MISPQGIAASLMAIAHVREEGSDKRTALERQLQQVRYEVERAFAQYDQVEPGNRLVAEVLEQRWNSKLEEQRRIAQELDDLNDATAALTPDDELTLCGLGEHFADAWNSDACPMTLKKRIARTLIKEIVVDIDAAQQINMAIHWQWRLSHHVQHAKAHVGCRRAQDRHRRRRYHHAHGTALRRR